MIDGRMIDFSGIRGAKGYSEDIARQIYDSMARRGADTRTISMAITVALDRGADPYRLRDGIGLFGFDPSEYRINTLMAEDPARETDRQVGFLMDNGYDRKMADGILDETSLDIMDRIDDSINPEVVPDENAYIDGIVDMMNGDDIPSHRDGRWYPELDENGIDVIGGTIGIGADPYVDRQIRRNGSISDDEFRNAMRRIYPDEQSFTSTPAGDMIARKFAEGGAKPNVKNMTEGDAAMYALHNDDAYMRYFDDNAGYLYPVQLDAAVKKAYDSAEDYNVAQGDRFAKGVVKGPNKAAPYVGMALTSPWAVEYGVAPAVKAGVAALPWVAEQAGMAGQALGAAFNPVKWGELAAKAFPSWAGANTAGQVAGAAVIDAPFAAEAAPEVWDIGKKYLSGNASGDASEGVEDAITLALDAPMLSPVVKSLKGTPGLMRDAVNSTKKYVGKKLGMVEDINNYSDPTKQFRIVDRPAIDDAIQNGVIRSKTGLYHGTPEYLRKEYGDQIKNIPGWETMDAFEIIRRIEDQLGERLPLTSRMRIRNSTNHGGTVGYYSGEPYPAYGISKSNYVIETPTSESFVAGHHGSKYNGIDIENTDVPTVLVNSDGSIRHASIPTDGSAYWGYDPFWELWRKKQFAEGGDTDADIVTRRYNGRDITADEYMGMKADEIRNKAVDIALARNSGVAPRDAYGNPLASCIYTFGDNYRQAGEYPEVQAWSNYKFNLDPSAYGFVANGPVENSIKGDMYQFLVGDIPTHATMITGYNGEYPLITESQGHAERPYATPLISEDEYENNVLGYKDNYDTYEDYVKAWNKWKTAYENEYKKNVKVGPHDVDSSYETYRYIGTPRKRADWMSEYESFPETLKPLPRIEFDYPRTLGEGGPAVKAYNKRTGKKRK